MKYFYFLNLLFAIVGPLHSQSGYFMGYNNGFRFGCQCTDIPPKNVSTYTGPYDKGYADGKLDGSIYAQHKMNNRNQQNSGYRYSANDLYVPDFDLVYQALSYRQNTHLSNSQRISEYQNQDDLVFNRMIQIGRDAELIKRSGRWILAFRLKNRLLEKANYLFLDYSVQSNFNYVKSVFENYISEMKAIIDEVYSARKKTVKKISDVKVFYQNASNVNQKVSNGWHNVYVTNNLNFCEERKVYVENGIITKYCIDDCFLRNIDLSQNIVNCRSIIKLSDNEEFLEVYFLDFISQKGSLSFSPQNLGAVSFWTDITLEKYDNIDIIVEGIWIGGIERSFYGTTPACKQFGTLNYENKPGTYNYKAISNKYDWSGTITISANQCKTQKLVGR